MAEEKSLNVTSVTISEDEEYRRNTNSTRCDLISELPVEVSELILGLLPVRDLEMCLIVSESWRRVTNQNHLWKRHCLSENLELLKVKGSDKDENDLCQYARIWLDFRTSPAFNWRWKSWKMKEFDTLKYNDFRLTSDGNSILTCNGSLMSLRRLPRLDEEIDLHFPWNFPINPRSLFVENNFVAVAKYNIVLIYKVDKKQKLRMALAFDQGSIFFQETNIQTFIRQHINDKMSRIQIRGFYNGHIWLIEQVTNKCYVVDINTKNVTITPTLSKRYHCSGKRFFISSTRFFVRLENIEGKAVLTLSSEYPISDILVNKELMVTIKEISNGRNQMNEFENVFDVWDIRTGEFILQKQLIESFESRYVIHPSHNIIYLYADCIKAFCLNTGKFLWKTIINSSNGRFLKSLDVVCEKYLITFDQLGAQPIYHVLDAFSGKFIYSVIKPGLKLVSIHDNFIIWRHGHKLYEKMTYLKNMVTLCNQFDSIYKTMPFLHRFVAIEYIKLLENDYFPPLEERDSGLNKNRLSYFLEKHTPVENYAGHVFVFITFIKSSDKMKVVKDLCGILEMSMA